MTMSRIASFATTQSTGPLEALRPAATQAVAVPTWDTALDKLEESLAGLVQTLQAHGHHLVLVTHSAQPSLRASMWVLVKQLGVPVVSIDAGYRDKSGTDEFSRAVDRALLAQSASFGGRKDLKAKSYRAQEEATGDDLSSEEEQQLLDLLNAAIPRGQQSPS